MTLVSDDTKVGELVGCKKSFNKKSYRHLLRGIILTMTMDLTRSVQGQVNFLHLRGEANKVRYHAKDSALTDKSLHDNFNKSRFAVLSEIKAGFDKQHTNILKIVSTMEDGDLEEEYKCLKETNEENHHVTLLSVENQTPSKNIISELIEKYSSLSKIQRILAYIL
ncbi:hypothetical protein NQ318_023658 [Aromia moschata]|uniref:Uncharacterized protein n=1 Tax=Aromia moschata TaxID=1265417 RepID=A0AAV8XS50_9CUCU|nr:hypothetical protein NQ318_023658 [Aromia moschata]